jgi:TolA-binding protein
MTTSPSQQAPPSSSPSNGVSGSSLPPWRSFLSTLNWRRDPGYEQRKMQHEQRKMQYEQRKMQHEQRMKQLEGEIELLRSESAQIERETAQLKSENARLAELNAKIDALWPSSTFNSTRARPPAADSPT